MSSRGNDWHPWRHLSRHHPHIVVEHRVLPPGLLGYTDLSAGRIVLHQHLTQSERRCTLTHELGHVRRGYVPNDPHLAAREEQIVHDHAARQLVTLDDLVEALLWSTHGGEVADELWVDPDILSTRLAGLEDHERTAIADRLADAPQWSA